MVGLTPLHWPIHVPTNVVKKEQNREKERKGHGAEGPLPKVGELMYSILQRERNSQGRTTKAECAAKPHTCRSSRGTQEKRKKTSTGSLS